jgi:antitoxin MazE
MTITHVKKWGNSYGIRISQSLLAQLNLQAGGEIEILLENGRLIISPIKSTPYSLDELLSKITPDNLHDEMDFGNSVGKEVW